ncbi:MAG TPA: hypothetical protein VHD76_03985 [Bryobacteraceae bacterium]|jgi:hypothetical protein|nr:hypothetical protein [Bryobacteraceae bacterium]
MNVRLTANTSHKERKEQSLVAEPSRLNANVGWSPNRAYFALVERFRDLRRTRPSLTVAFTSVVPGEGVTYVVDGLTRELARQSGGRVISIPVSDLRNPATMDAFLQEEVVESLTPMWRKGRPEGWNESETVPVKRQLDALEKRFDYVLVNCRSLKQSADAMLIGKHCAGVCLVVAAGTTTRSQIQGALAALSLASVPVLGFVLNKRTYPVPDFIYRFL